MFSHQNNRIHFGICNGGNGDYCEFPVYIKAHKKGHPKFNKMTHMTANIYKLVKIISSIVGINFNLCVYNNYNIINNEKIGIHSDTQTLKTTRRRHKKNGKMLIYIYKYIFSILS